MTARKPKTSTVELPPTPAGVQTVHAPVDPEKLSDKSEASVIDSTGRVIRTYTLAVHGPAFSESAASYASKIRGTVRLK